MPRKVATFKEEALILPGPVVSRWSAGRALYGVGTGLSMTATTVGSIGAIVLAAGGSSASPSDPGPALSLAGSVGNITGTGFLIGGLILQHSALGMIGKDSGRTKFVTGLVFAALGLASVGTGYVLGGVDLPNKDIINYAVGYGGTVLLTTASSILINDARSLRRIWDTLGMRPFVPVSFPGPDGGAVPPPGIAPYPPQQQPPLYPR